MKGLVIFILGAVVLSVALIVFVAPYASSSPDGLEKVADDIGLLEQVSQEKEIWNKAPLPDYATPGVISEVRSTIIAGLLGMTICLVAGMLLGALLIKRKKKSREARISR